MDYKHTLNLPNTDFKMKANLPEKEPCLLNFWGAEGIYEKIKQARADCPKYILHDGPPYANGHIHIGHALNKTLKDIVVKYKTMRGYYCEYIPGWDCHGLPVEHELFKKLKKKKSDIPQVEFRKKAYDYAIKFVDIQKQEFKRLGIFGEWDSPYLTTDRAYEASIVRSLAKLTCSGYIYKGLKPVNYCYRCETALAEAEVEYSEHISPSVYVKFLLKDKPKFLVDDLNANSSYMLIWTTTPWTLIANVAIAVHPDKEYVVVSTDHENIILAKNLLDNITEKTGLKNYSIVKTVLGSELENIVYRHPFDIRDGKIVLAEYVSMEEGTGCVHTAPGHGQEDYITGQLYGLDTVMPVDEKGRFTDYAGEFKGENVHKANAAIIEKLEGLKLLLWREDISHSYPFCWRCKSPIIFRATEQWFLAIDHKNLRGSLLEEIKKIRWIPTQGQERISAMVGTRPDWCLSRQRYWGVPIPVFQCEKCKDWIADSVLMENFANIVQDKGADAWFELDAKSLLPDGYECRCRGKNFKKGEDIVDVWFESGISHQAVLKHRKNLSYPADLYLEGSDQHRGWFQSSLITSVAIDSTAAFKSVLTHGFVVDGTGRKMSKSVGNVVSPQEIIKDYGADILRLWVAFSDYNDDVRISDQIIARLVEAYRKIRNTARFMLGNIYDFDFDKHGIEYSKMREIDRWALSRAARFSREVKSFYEGFQFHKVYHNLYAFCVTDLSNFYMDLVKDILYTFKNDSFERRSCQSAIYQILGIIARVIAPVLVFTAEEIWQAMPKAKGMPESVHLSFLDDADSFMINDALEEKITSLRKIREAVLKVLEEKRAFGLIGSSLEARVVLHAKTEETYNFLKMHEKELPALFIVSQAEVYSDALEAPVPTDNANLPYRIEVDRAKGKKCNRCWNFSETIGAYIEHPNICRRCQNALDHMKGDIKQ
jgi:isoleucyl-tRNA synthetase